MVHLKRTRVYQYLYIEKHILYKRIQFIDSGAGLPLFGSELHCLIIIKHWVSCLNTLCLSILICQRWQQQGCCKILYITEYVLNKKYILLLLSNLFIANSRSENRTNNQLKWDIIIKQKYITRKYIFKYTQWYIHNATLIFYFM